MLTKDIIPGKIIKIGQKRDEKKSDYQKNMIKTSRLVVLEHLEVNPPHYIYVQNIFVSTE